MPVYLCVYCVVYIQLVAIHKVPASILWPRYLLFAICVICTVGPNVTYLIVSNKVAGFPSFCHVPVIPNHRQFVLFTLCSSLWTYLAGVVSLISMFAILVRIIRTTHATKRALESTVDSYEYSELEEKTRKTKMLNRTLRTVVWFPLTPILSLWFNQILTPVRYYTRKYVSWMQYINIALLMLEAVLLSIAFVDNPSVTDAFHAYWRRRKQERHGAVSLDEGRVDSGIEAGVGTRDQPLPDASVAPDLDLLAELE
ncbi:hypothetical protein GQ54DRAFT_295080 [Martensiomyces pterosporus]|nr:hypothetical protein GQ54DRAFT_295080 [Martensiomyces pterosporus]